jgi:glycosyltransferase involved in cell wall biosynthesis
MQVGDERIRVVFLISHLLDSGIERQAFTQAKHMDRSEFAVTLMTARTSRRETGQLEAAVRESGLRLVRVRSMPRCKPLRPVADVLNVLAAVLMLLRERPHVIYTHGLMVQHRRALAWLRPVAKWRLVHKEWNPMGLGCAHVQRRSASLARKADVVLAVSFHERRMLEAIPGYLPPRLEVLHNAFDPVCESAESSEPAQLPIGTVGRLCEQKDQHTFLRAAAIFHRSHPDVRYVIWGAGRLRSALMREAEALGIADCVQFPGVFAPSDTASVYTRMTVFTLTSVDEGIANVVVEAMLNRRPIVATAVGGVVELLEDGVNAMLVRPADAEGIARAWEALLGDADLRRELGEAAHAKAVSMCHPTKVCSRLADIFGSLAAPAAANARATVTQTTRA